MAALDHLTLPLISTSRQDQVVSVVECGSKTSTTKTIPKKQWSKKTNLWLRVSSLVPMAALGLALVAVCLKSFGYVPSSLLKGEEETCEETYGGLPCSTSIPGNLFLMIAYGYLVLVAAKLISDGSEMLLQVLDPGLIGGLVLPVLGALPDSLLIVVSGLFGTQEEAQESVLVGMGVLAGSTIMILTIAWGGSLYFGRCDLVQAGSGKVAKDRTLTRPYDLVETGITTDEQTRVGAWIMMASILPFVVLQIPLIDGQPSQGQTAALIGLILCVAGLVAYCVYQVMSPWLQKSRIEFARLSYIRSLAIRDLDRYTQNHTLGGLLNEDGSHNSETIERVFNNFDEDKNGELSRIEIRALITGLGIHTQGAVPEEEEVKAWMSEFDTNADGQIGLEEFTRGMARWINSVSRDGDAAKHKRSISAEQVINRTFGGSPRSATGNGNFQITFDRSATMAAKHLQELNAELEEDIEDEEEDEENEVPKTPMEIYRDAILLMAGGALLVAVFADPVVDSITAFSKASRIPPFFVAFVVTPIVSNASELISSLIFAMKKRKRTISLTYSQVYGAITMNNTMCMGVFLALVYFRGLVWEFSAEVVVILLTTFLVGILGGTRKTFPTWFALPVLSLYPLSLAIVAFLDSVLGWK